MAISIGMPGSTVSYFGNRRRRLRSESSPDVRVWVPVNPSRSDQVSVRRGSRVFAPEIWSENIDEAFRCLSVASFGPRDVFTPNLGSGRMSGSPFLVTNLYEARKVTALRHKQLDANNAHHFTSPSP